MPPSHFHASGATEEEDDESDEADDVGMASMDEELEEVWVPLVVETGVFALHALRPSASDSVRREMIFFMGMLGRTDQYFTL